MHNSPSVEDLHQTVRLATQAARATMPAVTRTQMALVGAFFGAAFALSSALRGNVLPGIVAGALAAAVVYLVLQRVQEHNDAVRRRRERRERGEEG